MLTDALISLASVYIPNALGGKLDLSPVIVDEVATEFVIRLLLDTAEQADDREAAIHLNCGFLLGSDSSLLPALMAILPRVAYYPKEPSPAKASEAIRGSCPNSLGTVSAQSDVNTHLVRKFTVGPVTSGNNHESKSQEKIYDCQDFFVLASRSKSMSGASGEMDSPVEVIVENKELIEAQSPEIRQALNDIFGSGRVVDTDDRIVDTIMMSLADQADSETAGIVSQSLVNFIGRSNSDLINQLSKRCDDDTFVADIRSLAFEYRKDVREKKFADLQGQNWWSYINSSVIHRPSAIGFEHHVTIAQKERVRFDSDLSGAVIIATHFADEVAGAIEDHGEAMEQQVDPRAIAKAAESLQRCTDRLNELQEKNEDDTESNQ